MRHFYRLTGTKIGIIFTFAWIKLTPATLSQKTLQDACIYNSMNSFQLTTFLVNNMQTPPLESG